MFEKGWMSIFAIVSILALPVVLGMILWRKLKSRGRARQSEA